MKISLFEPSQTQAILHNALEENGVASELAQKILYRAITSTNLGSNNESSLATVEEKIAHIVAMKLKKEEEKILSDLANVLERSERRV